MTIARINNESQSSPGKRDTKENSPMQSGKRPVILVVDDDEKILKLLEVNLLRNGYQVISAYNGNSALECIDQLKPDLVILDVMMPGLNGFQVLDLIQKRHSIPIIIMTARWEMITNQETPQLSTDNYLRKPFNVSELMDIVTKKLRSVTDRES